MTPATFLVTFLWPAIARTVAGAPQTVETEFFFFVFWGLCFVWVPPPKLAIAASDFRRTKHGNRWHAVRDSLTSAKRLARKVRLARKTLRSEGAVAGLSRRSG